MLARMQSRLAQVCRPCDLRTGDICLEIKDVGKKTCHELSRQHMKGKVDGSPAAALEDYVVELPYYGRIVDGTVAEKIPRGL